MSIEKALEVVRSRHPKEDDHVWLQEDDPRVYILNDVSDALYQEGYSDVEEGVLQGVTDKIVEESG